MKLKVLVSIGLAVVLTGCVSVPKTTLTINPVTHQIAWSNPKDTIITGLNASVGTNGTSIITIASISTVMNPTNISAAGTAEANIVTATGAVIQNALNTAAGAAVQFVK